MANDSITNDTLALSALFAEDENNVARYIQFIGDNPSAFNVQLFGIIPREHHTALVEALSPDHIAQLYSRYNELNADAKKMLIRKTFESGLTEVARLLPYIASGAYIDDVLEYVADSLNDGSFNFTPDDAKAFAAKFQEAMLGGFLTHRLSSEFLYSYRHILNTVLRLAAENHEIGGSASPKRKSNSFFGQLVGNLAKNADLIVASVPAHNKAQFIKVTQPLVDRAAAYRSARYFMAVPKRFRRKHVVDLTRPLRKAKGFKAVRKASKQSLLTRHRIYSSGFYRPSFTNRFRRLVEKVTDSLVMTPAERKFLIAMGNGVEYKQSQLENVSPTVNRPPAVRRTPGSVSALGLPK